MGWFQENTSNEALVALAQGIRTPGMFFTYPYVPLHDADVVRSPETGLYIRIIGDNLTRISEFAEWEHKRFTAKVIDRSELG